MYVMRCCVLITTATTRDLTSLCEKDTRRGDEALLFLPFPIERRLRTVLIVVCACIKTRCISNITTETTTIIITPIINTRVRLDFRIFPSVRRRLVHLRGSQKIASCNRAADGGKLLVQWTNIKNEHQIV